MQRPSVKSLIIWGLVAAMALLSGCAALRFGYNQAPEFAYWWMDRYVAFDDAQSARAKDEIAEWFRWHRANQLPVYAQRVSQASAEALEPTTGDKVCRWYDDIAARAPASFERALPAVADLALTLKPEQLKNIARRFDKVNREFREDHVQADREERLDAEVERIEDRAKTLYGSIDKAQRERLRQQIAASPFDAERWDAERRARQQEVLQMLRTLHAERATPQQAQAAIRTVYDHIRRSPREGYRSYVEKMRPAYCAMAADLHNSTTPEQRQTAAKRLKGWETDLRVLAAAAAP